VRPGTALFEESLRRGSSYYLPGLCIPMLPRALSEGITSLNEKQLRRAVVFRMAVDASGECVETRVERARMRSRAQLTFRQVQRFLDDDEPLPDRAAEPSVRLLRDVGRARMRRSEQRDVIHYRRTEVEVKLSREFHFVIDLAPRSSVEKYNEQLSLMCNIEGACLLRDGAPSAEVQPIYRVHASPNAQRYRKLEELLGAIAKRHRLGNTWRWKYRGKTSLADFLKALPHDGAQARIASAIHRQAVLTNVRSVFSDEPAGHHGVGAEVYARFSAPMRELVGVFLHKELFEKLEGTRGDARNDEELRHRIIERANESKALQKRLTKEANRIVLDELFEADRQRPRDERPLRKGTVMGITPSKAHILLDDPRIEVKVYTRHQSQVIGSTVRMSDDGAALLAGDAELCRIGDEVSVQVHDRDQRGDRWMLVIR
jgi:ribonuclease R